MLSSLSIPLVFCGAIWVFVIILASASSASFLLTPLGGHIADSIIILNKLTIIARLPRQIPRDDDDDDRMGYAIFNKEKWPVV